MPHAVFSEPQVASVGLTEEQAEERELRYVTKIQEYAESRTAGRWRTPRFAKLIADPATGLLLGAHIIGPQAPT